MQLCPGILNLEMSRKSSPTVPTKMPRVVPTGKTMAEFPQLCSVVAFKVLVLLLRRHPEKEKLMTAMFVDQSIYPQSNNI